MQLPCLKLMDRGSTSPSYSYGRKVSSSCGRKLFITRSLACWLYVCALTRGAVYCIFKTGSPSSLDRHTMTTTGHQVYDSFLEQALGRRVPVLGIYCSSCTFHQLHRVYADASVSSLSFLRIQRDGTASKPTGILCDHMSTANVHLDIVRLKGEIVNTYAAK